jgi:hypothetical protein
MVSGYFPLEIGNFYDQPVILLDQTIDALGDDPSCVVVPFLLVHEGMLYCTCPNEVPFPTCYFPP